MLSSLIEFLSYLMVNLIGLSHRVTQTYWIDIILLTLFVRLLVSPINRKQTQAMKAMADLQPEMKALQEQYKDNPQEMQKQTMELYKKHGVNPFASCFPMLIQMPVLISLFYVLRMPKFYKLLPGFDISSMFGAKLTIPSLVTAPFPEIESLHGMVDLGALFNYPFFWDKYLYLPALPLFAVYIATTILQTKMMSSQSSQQQSSQMNFMMPLILYLGLIFPVGLLLYFGLTNLFQMQQYYVINKAEKLKIAGQANGEGSGEEGNGSLPPPPKKRKKKRKK